jgi:hypothetical protein
MNASAARYLILLAALAAAPALAACGISVDKDENGRNADVNIRSPFGSVSVQADKDTPPDTGLPVRPGARVSHADDHDNANVNVEAGPFAVKVRVARYEHDDTPDAVLEYYRKELARYGSVTECRGNLDFKNGSAMPRCKERARDELQLGAGSEQDNHVVSVKPRGSGSEFTLVHVTTSRG